MQIFQTRQINDKYPIKSNIVTNKKLINNEPIFLIWYTQTDEYLYLQ